MKIEVNEYTSTILLSIVGSLATLCLIAGIWGYHRRSARGYYLRDFERLFDQATQLNNETTKILKAVDEDDAATETIKMANMEVVGDAADWDTSIQMALSAWKDIMQPDEEQPSDSDTSKEERVVRDRRKAHSRYVVRLMRKQVLVGIKRRKGFSAKLQKIQNELTVRKQEIESSQLNRRLTCGLEIRHECDIIANASRLDHIFDIDVQPDMSRASRHFKLPPVRPFSSINPQLWSPLEGPAGCPPEKI